MDLQVKKTGEVRNDSMRKYLFESRLTIIIYFFISFANNICNVYIAIILKQLIDFGTARETASFYKTLVFAGVCLLLSTLIGFFTKLIQAKFLNGTMVRIKDDLFFKILKLDIKTFTVQNSSAYISTIMNDVAMLEQNYFSNIMTMIDCIFSFVIATILLFFLNVYLGIAIVSLEFLTLLVPFVFKRRLAKERKEYSDALTLFTGKLKDMLTGFNVIKNFDIEDRAGEIYHKTNAFTENKKYKYNVVSGIAELVGGFWGGFIFITVIGLGIYLTMIGMSTIGTTIAATQLINNIANPVMQISYRLNKIKSVQPIAEKIQTILDKDDNLNVEGISKDSFENGITLTDVSYTYGNRNSAINNIDFDFLKGCKYAVVGGSGSGKSTLLKVISGSYSDFSGNIYIDNDEIKNINSKDLCRLVSFMNQEVFLFDASLKENISLNKQYTPLEMERAIEFAGLQDFVKNKPGGLDIPVGENGCTLSGGERQRVSIARTVIRNTPILLMDEVTSSLDAKTAWDIEQNLLRLPSVTTIVVTHKLSRELLKQYDCIIVLKDGNIVEQGTFDKLMHERNYFYSLYTISEESHKGKIKQKFIPSI